MAEENNNFNEKFEEIKEDTMEAYGKAKEKAQAAIDQIKSEIDDYTDEVDPEDVKENKLMAALAYIGILVLIPIFAAKDSKFARFHANQGLVLFIIEAIAGALATAKVLGWLFGIVDFVCLILAIVGIVYAVQGKAKELPVIGNIKLLK